VEWRAPSEGATEMKYLLSHRTSYSYASSVDSAHHIAHLRAREFPGQKVSSLSITTTPAPAMAVRHVDHFGNLIDIYSIDSRTSASTSRCAPPSTYISPTRRPPARRRSGKRYAPC
jgi:hypothetical protein